MFRMMLGGAIGMAMGVGMMMSSAGRSIRRDVHHGMNAVRRWMRNM